MFRGVVLGGGAKNDEREDVLITFSEELKVEATASTLEIGTRIRKK